MEAEKIATGRLTGAEEVVKAVVHKRRAATILMLPSVYVLLSEKDEIPVAVKTRKKD